MPRDVRPQRPRAFVEDLAGTASVSLRLLGSGQPLTGYMGSKRSYAVDILGALGLRTGIGTDHLVLVDAGPWGDVWSTLTDGGWSDVACVLRSWADEDPFDLWERLRDEPMPERREVRAAAYLWLQARAANNTPVWWWDGLPRDVASSSRLAHGAVAAAQRNYIGPPCQVHGSTDAAPGLRQGNSPGRSAARDKPAYQQGIAASTGSGNACQKGSTLTMAEKRARGRREKGAIQRSRQHSRRCNGVQRVETIARRVEALGLLSWPKVTILRSHPTSADLAALLGGEDLAGVVVYQDPPYQGCTPYAVDCGRDQVLALAEERRQWGATVAVSEAVALPLHGWHALDITRASKPEWLTMSSRPSIAAARQLTLWCA